ncbi:MAG: GNAT family N-acetyltransferase [Clostridiaceae bacterium]|nr:GNAT family N-acetyltransferase [Clostridiaceae bacterium]
MDITLREIDRSNWEACCSLKVAPSQRNFVAINAYSLAQAAYEPDTFPMGIFCDGTLVGFLMWDFDSQIGVWEMCRLMVDETHQGKGIGRTAVSKLLTLVRNKLGPIRFYTSADPDNTAAIGLYEALGFRKNGQIVYDEVMLEIQL